MTLNVILLELQTHDKVELTGDEAEKLDLYINYLQKTIQNLSEERKELYECNRALREKL